jgi:Holliday junction resolvase RusA-like endonuclease
MTGVDIDLTVPYVIEFTVHMRPYTLMQRRLGRGLRYYGPSRARQQQFIVMAANEEPLPQEPWRGKIRATLTFFFPIPASRHDVEPGDYCGNNSDVDNLVKFVFDAIQGFYIANDRDVVEVHAVKKWSLNGSTHVRLELLP